MMYFYDNCFSMMFLSDFWLQSWINRWFTRNEELPTQASRISMRLILIFMHFLDIIRAMNRFLCNWFFFYFYAFLSQPCKQVSNWFLLQRQWFVCRRAVAVQCMMQSTAAARGANRQWGLVAWTTAVVWRGQGCLPQVRFWFFMLLEPQFLCHGFLCFDSI